VSFEVPDKIKVSHPALHGGDCCPECAKRKVYRLSEPAALVRITGMAPLGATVYECDRLRCNLCGEVFTAPAPTGVREQKHDETATSGWPAQVRHAIAIQPHREATAGPGLPLPAERSTSRTHPTWS
jgi:transposase